VSKRGKGQKIKGKQVSRGIASIRKNTGVGLEKGEKKKLSEGGNE